MKFDLFRYHRHSSKNVKIFSIHLSVNVCFNYLHPLTSNLLRKIIKFSMRRGISIEVSPALRSYIFIIKNEVRECRGNCHLAKLFDTIYKIEQTKIMTLQKICQIVIGSCLTKSTHKKYLNVPSKLLEHLEYIKCPINGFLKYQPHFYERNPLIISCCDNLFKFRYFYLPRQLPLLIIDYLKDYYHWNKCLSYDADSVKTMFARSNINYCTENYRKHDIIYNFDPFLSRRCTKPKILI